MTFADQVNDLLMGSDRLVTQYMHDWNGRMTPEAIRRVALLEERDNSAAGQEARRSGEGRIRPSNLGESCPRLHALSWLGYPAEKGDTSLMDDGTQRHYYWQKVGLSAGFLQDIEVKVQIPYLEIYGSMDGLMVDDSVFEFKETGPKLYDNIMANRMPVMSHLLQVHAYMKARGVKKASVVYEKRSFKVEWHEFRIDWDQSVYDMLIDRIAPVLNALGEGEVPPMIEECIGLSGPKFKGCDYHAVCPSATFVEAGR